ncbi:hypothetical protein ES703_08523 [subsurface metagenome]
MVRMVHYFADDDAGGWGPIGLSRSGIIKDLPVITAIGETTVGFILFLWRGVVKVKNSVNDSTGIFIKQANIFVGITSAKFETGMQRPFAGFIIGPDNQKATSRNKGRSRVISGNHPHTRLIKIIFEVHATYVNGFAAIVVDFNPVIIITPFVPDSAITVIAGHKLVNHQRDFAVVLEPVFC